MAESSGPMEAEQTQESGCTIQASPKASDPGGCWLQMEKEVRLSSGETAPCPLPSPVWASVDWRTPRQGAGGFCTVC